MSCAGVCLLLVSAVASTALPGKRLIATGWDNPTAAVLASATAFGGPFDGWVVEAERAGTGPVNRRPFRETFSATPWSAGWFETAVAVLGSSGRAAGSFLVVNANPGSVDWFDDAGWAVVVEHWRLAARTAKRGGLRGLAFDPEPYRKPYRPFAYAAQPDIPRRTFAAYAARVRERGRAVMRAVAGEFPDAVILSYFLLSSCLDAVPPGGGPPVGLERFGYGLLPAFVEGWLDAIPPSLTLVDGCESAYCFNSEVEFLREAVRVKGDACRLIAPECRAAYRAQVEVGFGIYLDAYVNPPGSKYFVDGLGGTRADRLRANVRTALAAADRYVWIYGEQGRWWPRTADDAEAYAPWSRVLPGCAAALDSAHDSVPDAW